MIKQLKRLGLTAVLWLTLGCASAPPAVPGFTLLTLDAQALAVTRQRIATGDARVLPAFNALRKRADKALLAPLRSVTHKTRMPPSGSKNDYMSMGPYWWPNPSTPDGLPYIQRDGQRNPQAIGDALDSDRLQALLADCRDLALAYHFTADGRYANKVAAALRTWFLDPATRMNPSLRFAQGIPGIVDGRGLGIIDTRDLWWVIDSLALIAPSNQVTPTEEAGLRQWFADYAQWLDTSALGRDEAAAKNNHGQFFDVQQAVYWLFTGQTERARELLFSAQTLRFAAQIDTAGRMPLELARTRPYHYHTFTLEASTRLARYAQYVAVLPAPANAWPRSDARCATPEKYKQCPLDLWALNVEGKSLRGVLDFVAQVAVDPASWRHATTLEPTPPLATALPILLMAQRMFAPGSFDKALVALQPLAPEHVAWLLWPTP